MKRSAFLKNILAAGAVIGLAPKVLAEPERKLEIIDDHTIKVIGSRRDVSINLRNLRCDDKTPKEILEIYMATGVLLWSRQYNDPPEYLPIQFIDK